MLAILPAFAPWSGDTNFGALQPRKPGAVAAGALDRPGAVPGCVLLGEAKHLAIAARVRGDRLPRHDRTGRGGHGRQHVLVQVRVDTDDVVQLICKHLDRSSDLCS